jgi:hypothetical protein
MDKTRKIKLKCAITGLLAGTANGFFGAGGGMLLVPLFSRWVKLDQRSTFATSLAVIFPMCIVSAVVGIFKSGFSITSALPYLVGGLAGGFMGGHIYTKIPVKWLHRIMGVLIIYGGIKNLL